MRGHRLVAVLLAAVTTTAATLAMAQPAQAANIVRLVSGANGMCLQPADNAPLSLIIQMPCTGVVAQQWNETVKKNNIHLQNRASGLCMEVLEGPYNGSIVDQWFCGPNSNERWTYGITNSLLGSRISGTGSHCVASPGPQAGLPVSLRFCSGDISQRWSHPAG